MKLYELQKKSIGYLITTHFEDLLLLDTRAQFFKLKLDYKGNKDI